MLLKHSFLFYILPAMEKLSFLLYGANGYSGELIARFAHQYGLQPILAGRNTAAIEALAGRLQLPYRIVDLNDNAGLQTVLREVKLVAHMAGPYDHTARPMIEACLATGTHYIDLNGDTGVFELLHGYNQAAIEKNIMILPGAGFDVIPTDCLALWLKNRLPDANHLEIAFVIVGSGLSRGTSITTLQKLGMPGAVRKDGKLIEEPMGKRGRWIDFPEDKHRSFMMSIPWGDISTAYFSTGIPNIETYTGISKATWLFLKGQSLFNWLLRSAFMHRLIRAIIVRKSAGPGDEQRNRSFSLIWGKVTNAGGQSLVARMRCPEAYALTTTGVLLIAKKILEGNFKAGYQTPASAYGEDLVMEIEGVKRYES